MVTLLDQSYLSLLLSVGKRTKNIFQQSSQCIPLHDRISFILHIELWQIASPTPGAMLVAA